MAVSEEARSLVELASIVFDDLSDAETQMFQQIESEKAVNLLPNVIDDVRVKVDDLPIINADKLNLFF